MAEIRRLWGIWCLSVLVLVVAPAGKIADASSYPFKVCELAKNFVDVKTLEEIREEIIQILSEHGINADDHQADRVFQSLMIGFFDQGIDDAAIRMSFLTQKQDSGKKFFNQKQARIILDNIWEFDEALEKYPFSEEVVIQVIRELFWKTINYLKEKPSIDKSEVLGMISGVLENVDLFLSTSKVNLTPEVRDWLSRIDHFDDTFLSFFSFTFASVRVTENKISWNEVRKLIPYQEIEADEVERAETSDEQTDERKPTGQWRVEESQITFKDIAGLEHVKESMRTDILLPLEKPELAKAFKKTVTGGRLLYGPPGNGKTHFVKAIAGEAGGLMISVSSPEVLDPYVGNTEKNIRSVFANAREVHRSTGRPVFLFFDEFEAIAPSRRSTDKNWEVTAVGQLLTELGENDTGLNDGVVVIYATNNPSSIDSAILRSGRTKQQYFIDLPEGDAINNLIEILLRGLPVQAGLNISELAARMAGKNYSAADIKKVVELAGDMALKRSYQENKVSGIRMDDFFQAIAMTGSSINEEELEELRLYSVGNLGGSYMNAVDSKQIIGFNAIHQGR